MTDSHAALVDRNVVILANHSMRLSYRTQIVSCWGCDWTADYGLGVASDVLHRAHLAAVLAESVAADIWDEGHARGIWDLQQQTEYAKGLGVWPEPPRDTPNPYVRQAGDEQ